MHELTRRNLLANTAMIGAGLGIGGGMLPSPLAAQRRAAPGAPPVVALSWLGNAAPAVPSGVAWGVPWPRGAVSPRAPIVVRGAGGQAVAAQSWPMAYWPDGSIKWTGLAIAADARSTGLTVSAGGRPAPAPKTRIVVADGARAVVVRTGALTATINKSGEGLIASLMSGDREVARDGRLVVLREDRSQSGAGRTVREESFVSRIAQVTVEQSGPVRAVVHIRGVHAAAGGGGREWLPFSVRLYFTAGLNSVKMVHSFVFDGKQKTDFIKGIGLAFAVPFREETQNRHIRLATGPGNIFAEPVLMAPGYRPAGIKQAAAYQRAQLAGQRIPNLAAMPAQESADIKETATWADFKLAQLSSDGWELYKRTNPDSSWLRVTSGGRAGGLAFLGDVSGGLAIGLKDFWQKYPASLEIANAAAPAGELKIWFWSPDAAAMDLRHYDTVGHGLRVTYEDYEPELADAIGAANTSELMLWATPDTPAPETLEAMTRTSSAPPLLICSPEHYHATQTLGFWSLRNTPTPGLSAADIASAETQLDRAFAFFDGEVERRRWYGFWDYGDYRRTYDPIRRQWMYDIGGHGWNATELMPNVWLWFAFLRSGRADIFRAAEAMTRNTNEVDVHHIGPFASLGSRHNVSHWGDAKEARINEAFIKRFYYYLTTDDRTGDLMREPLGLVEASMSRYPPLRKVAPRPDIKPPLAFIRFGPDWLALASNWMAEWERTGDLRYRDYCLTGMRDIGAMPEALLARAAFIFDPATKHLRDAGEPNQRPGQFVFLFAGDQIAYELMSLIDCPEFVAAWNRLCVQFTEGKRSNWYFEPRVTAFAANATGRGDLQERALGLYRGLLRFGKDDYFRATPESFDGPTVTQPAKENPGTSTFTPSIATPEVSQWAINLITMPELLRAFRPRAT